MHIILISEASDAIFPTAYDLWESIKFDQTGVLLKCTQLIPSPMDHFES